MTCSIQLRSLRLHAPFRAGTWNISKRDILLFRIHDADVGLSGYGEAAPLPAFGTETFEEALSALRRYALKPEWNKDAVLAEDGGNVLPEEFDATPSARCAIETALLDLEARKRDVSLARLLSGEAAAVSLPVNAIIGGVSREDTLRQTEAALRQGFSCLKLKVGLMDEQEDIRRVLSVREHAGSGVRLRLDANRAWSSAQARAVLPLLAEADIEYIEEPVRDIEEFHFLKSISGIAIAADESAQRRSDAEHIIETRSADILIVKVMTAGGPLAARSIAKRALAAGMDVVCTSFIDSAVGRHTAAQLCASLPECERHHGLATAALFQDDTGRDILEQGRFLLYEGSGLGLVPEGGEWHASA
jgi:L-Ala-D/L-Glu epimerase